MHSMALTRQLQALHVLLVKARSLAGNSGNSALYKLLDGVEILPSMIASGQEVAFRQQVEELSLAYGCAAAAEVLSLSAPGVWPDPPPITT